MSSFKIAMAPQKETHLSDPALGLRASKLVQIVVLALAIIFGAGWVVGLYYTLSELANSLAAVVAVQPH